MTKCTSWVADKIEHWPIEKLIPYARNARTHSDAQVAQIAASIREFGFTNPVLIDGQGNIIAGHGRVLAARKLGMQEVPCIRMEHLTDAQRRAYIIADNKLALNAGWDDELLALELQELKELDFDLELTGFGAEEVETILDTDTFTGLDHEWKSNYTTKIDAPLYQPTGECPPISALYDASKYNDLAASINNNSSLTPDVREFLLLAATRHIRFDFEQIAEFYAHADDETQHLMEESALVIIDFDKAISGGYVMLSNRIAEIYEMEKEADQ